MNNNISEYDKEPVYYCSRCLSLEIKADIGDYCYCDKCGSTGIEQTSIFEWERMYKDRYGRKFLENKF